MPDKSLLNDPLPLAVVTGAARRVGRLIALHLADQGYAIGLHYHKSRAEAESTANEISQKTGVPVYLLPANLTAPDEIKALFVEVKRIPHELRLLVNSAALMTPSDLTTLDTDSWDALFDLNTRAVWLCSREAAALMSHGGVILNISDAGAGKNWARYGGYVVSKAAVESLTRVMALQLAPEVRVCAIAPGLLMRAENQSVEEWERLVEKVPLKRSAEKEEFFAAMDFLISNQYITGEVIALSGGYQLL